MNLSTRLESIAARCDKSLATAIAKSEEASKLGKLGEHLRWSKRAEMTRDDTEAIREAIRKLATKEKRGQFIPPTLDEVVTFARSKMTLWPVTDIERWWRHFESVGWKVASKPMVNWRMAAQNGFANWLEKSPARGKKTVSV